jgi:uncharacterized protein
MKRTPLCLILLLIILPACEGGHSHMSIGTGDTGGIYYPFGGALASRLSALDPERQFTAEVTAASVENVRRLRQGQLDIAMSISITAYQAFHGSDDFPEPFPEMRVIAPLWPNPLNLLVPGRSDVRSVHDLRGRRVAVGAPGSGTEQVTRAVLGAHGLSYDDVQQRFLGFTEASSAIRDGSIGAAFLEVAYPAAAVLEATTTGDARLIPVAGPEIDALIEEWPVFFPYVIPAGAYRGVTEDLHTIAELNWILAREDLDGDIVRMILDILHDERARLEQVNEIVRQIDLQHMRNAPLPLHPAAIEWMEERLPAAAQ